MLRRHRLVRSWVITVMVVGGVGMLLTYLLAPLNGNIRYEAGVKAVGTSTAAGTFSHRPLAFRMLMDAVFQTAHGLSWGIASFEFVVRVLVGAMAAAAGVLLRLGLREHNVRHAGLHAVVVVSAILMVGPGHAGEPDWMAVVLAAGGAGVALQGRRHPWVFATLSGALFVGAAGMKIVTLATALLALMVVALLDRRQLVRTLVSSTLIGGLYVIFTVLWVPWEVQWLLDIRSVQKDAVAALPDASAFFAELAARRPVLVLLPAALVLARRRERLVSLLAVGLAVVPIVGQGQYFAYHAVALVVVTAVVVFRALRSRMSTATGIGVLVVVVGAVVLSTSNAVWFVNHQKLWGGATVALGVAAVIWAFTVRERRVDSGRTGQLLAALATVALLYPGATPWAAGLVRAENPSGHRPLTTIETRTQHEETARRVRQVVGGSDVPVTYLTFGEWTYFIQNPTDCRFPSPLFLQRTRYSKRPVATPSYQENLACLSAADSRWLVWDPVWFRLDRTPREVQRIVAREWNCRAAVAVGELRLCPRRL